jgi:tetratricopeptide (TPR) repeat protein
MTTFRPALPRPLLVIAAALAVVAGSYGWAALHAPRPAAPIVAPVSGPFDGSVGAGSDPAALAGVDGRMSLNDQIAFWQARVTKTPKDFLSMIQLALAEASKARLTADLGLYQQAAATVDQALTFDPRSGASLRAKAQLAFSLHDFNGAITSAQAAIGRDPTDDGARGILGDALLEVGRLDDAQATYAAISPASAGPALDARLAHLELVRGHVDRAVQLAQQAFTEASADPDTDLAFYAYQLAETARQTGNDALARSSYDAALTARPNDLGSLVGLARIDAYDGNIAAALEGLRHAAAIAPQPDTLALIGDLLGGSADSAGADTQYSTVRAIETLGSTAGTVYDRQLLLFELDHGGATDAVLQHARDALAARPDATAHDIVAWALYRLGRPAEALAESRLALASGTRDARILAHTGAIEIAAGDVASGTRDLQAALALGPALDPALRSEMAALLARQ